MTKFSIKEITSIIFIIELNALFPIENSTVFFQSVLYHYVTPDSVANKIYLLEGEEKEKVFNFFYTLKRTSIYFFKDANSKLAHYSDKNIDKITSYCILNCDFLEI